MPRRQHPATFSMLKNPLGIRVMELALVAFLVLSNLITVATRGHASDLPLPPNDRGSSATTVEATPTPTPAGGGISVTAGVVPPSVTPPPRVSGAVRASFTVGP
jgi:hypothetical protein